MAGYAGDDRRSVCLEWRKHTPNNDGLNYRFDAKGTGAPGSEKELEIQWFMNREFRLGLLRDWTRKRVSHGDRLYPIRREGGRTQGSRARVELMNVLNQKGTRPVDKPMRLAR